MVEQVLINVKIVEQGKMRPGKITNNTARGQ